MLLLQSCRDSNTSSKKEKHKHLEKLSSKGKNPPNSGDIIIKNSGNEKNGNKKDFNKQEEEKRVDIINKNSQQNQERLIVNKLPIINDDNHDNEKTDNSDPLKIDKEKANEQTNQDLIITVNLNLSDDKTIDPDIQKDSKKEEEKDQNDDKKSDKNDEQKEKDKPNIIEKCDDVYIKGEYMYINVGKNKIAYLLNSDNKLLKGPELSLDIKFQKLFDTLTTLFGEKEEEYKKVKGIYIDTPFSGLKYLYLKGSFLIKLIPKNKDFYLILKRKTKNVWLLDRSIKNYDIKNIQKSIEELKRQNELEGIDYDDDACFFMPKISFDIKNIDYSSINSEIKNKLTKIKLDFIQSGKHAKLFPPWKPKFEGRSEIPDPNYRRPLDFDIPFSLSIVDKKTSKILFFLDIAHPKYFMIDENPNKPYVSPYRGM